MITVTDFLQSDLSFDLLSDDECMILSSLVQQAQFVSLVNINGYDEITAKKYSIEYMGDITESYALEFGKILFKDKF